MPKRNPKSKSRPPGHGSAAGSGPGGDRRFAFAPREAAGANTADSVTRDTRRRRNRQIVLAAVIGLIVVLSASLINLDNNDETAVQLGIESATVDQEGSVSIEGLSFKGVTDTGREFEILADQASESTDQPDLVIMDSPRATVETAGGNPITIRSDSGEFLRGSNTINLSGDVVIVRPDLGYTLRTEKAFADLESGELVSESPVRGIGPDGKVDSGGIIISGNEEGIVFTGRTTLVINTGLGPGE